jgi:hypothetical protein
VNTGFGEGGQWDDYYDDLEEGWRLFMFNLQLHLRHFAGRPATPALPAGYWPTDAATSWRIVADALGLPRSPQVGDRVTLDPAATVAGSPAPSSTRHRAGWPW